MSSQTILTIVGNLTADPELRFTQSGRPVANFTVASTTRQFDKVADKWADGDTIFMRCTVWGGLAENAARLTKGTPVIALGALEQHTYETKEGEKRTTLELTVSTLGAALRNVAPVPVPA